MVDIKPCPFCGVTPTQKAPGLNFQHPDNECFYGPSVIPLALIDAWNTRPTAQTVIGSGGSVDRSR